MYREDTQGKWGATQMTVRIFTILYGFDHQNLCSFNP